MVSRIGLAPRITTQRARPPQRSRLGAQRALNNAETTTIRHAENPIFKEFLSGSDSIKRPGAGPRPPGRKGKHIRNGRASGIPNSENRTTEFFVIRLASPGAKTEPESRHSIGSSVACLLRPVEPPSWRLTWRPPRCASRPTPSALAWAPLSDCDSELLCPASRMPLRIPCVLVRSRIPLAGALLPHLPLHFAADFAPRARPSAPSRILIWYCGSLLSLSSRRCSLVVNWPHS